MYGLKPEDISHLRTLEGKEVSQICVGQGDLQFHFHPDGNISVQGRCELLDQTNNVIDVWENGQRSKTFRFFELLGPAVVEIEIDSPTSFAARFQSGYALRPVDNSNQYESFSVGDLYV